MANRANRLLQLFFGLVSIFRSKVEVATENILLRQQLLSLKKKNSRMRLRRFDHFLWVFIRMVFNQWKKFLVMVKPETVIRWHRESECRIVELSKR